MKITHNSVDSGRLHLSSLRIIDSLLICPMKGQAEIRGDVRHAHGSTCDTKIEQHSGEIVPNAALSSSAAA